MLQPAEKDKDVCEICSTKIKTMAFRYTGVCSEDHRKDRAKLERQAALAAHPSNFRAQINRESA